MGVVYVNICMSKRLKEELAWAVDKWLQVVSNKMLFKTVIPKEKSHFKFKITLYTLLCDP